MIEYNKKEELEIMKSNLKYFTNRIKHGKVFPKDKLDTKKWKLTWDYLESLEKKIKQLEAEVNE